MSATSNISATWLLYPTRYNWTSVIEIGVSTSKTADYNVTELCQRLFPKTFSYQVSWVNHLFCISCIKKHCHLLNDISLPWSLSQLWLKNSYALRIISFLTLATDLIEVTRELWTCLPAVSSSADFKFKFNFSSFPPGNELDSNKVIDEMVHFYL